MQDALHIVGELSKTPLPTILVVSGVFFLFLSFVARVGGKFVVSAKRQKWAAIAGGVLLVFGTLLYVIEAPEPESSFQRSPDASVSPGTTADKNFELSRAFLIQNQWTFLHAEGDVISSHVQLDPSGEIHGIDHPNESRWALENGILIFFHADGQVSTRFTHIERKEGKVILSGRLLLTPPGETVIHVLTTHLENNR
jgi:hypothetical protein